MNQTLITTIVTIVVISFVAAIAMYFTSSAPAKAPTQEEIMKSRQPFYRDLAEAKENNMDLATWLKSKKSGLTGGKRIQKHSWIIRSLIAIMFATLAYQISSQVL